MRKRLFWFSNSGNSITVAINAKFIAETYDFLSHSGAEDYGHHRHDSVENQVPIWFRDINCPYDARGIDDCTVDWEDPRYCSNNDRANVICFAIRDGGLWEIEYILL